MANSGDGAADGLDMASVYCHYADRRNTRGVAAYGTPLGPTTTQPSTSSCAAGRLSTKQVDKVGIADVAGDWELLPVLLVFVLAGAAAQLVNGSLGMGFGVTSNTVLISYGIAPAVASATVNLANFGTGVVSGASHWRFGNVSWSLVMRIGVPGAVGAFIGATVLSSLRGDWIVPGVATVLFVLGVVVLVRAVRGDLSGLGGSGGQYRFRFLGPLGVVGGFTNAIGGGGWGPVTTPSLLAGGRIEPRFVIGSVSAAEVLVTGAASLGFAVGLGRSGLEASLLVALVAGGVVAAPIAALLVGRANPAVLGVGVGTLLLVLNTRTLMLEVGAPPLALWPALLVLLAGGVQLARKVRRVPQQSRDAVIRLPDGRSGPVARTQSPTAASASADSRL